MKTIMLTSAAMLMTVGFAMAQTPAAGTTGAGSNAAGTNGANSGMTNGTASTMSSNQTAVGTNSAMTGNGAGPNGMSMSQIQHKLASEGYVHIKDLRHNGKYEMVNAHRYGSYQKSLKIDPSTGQVVDQAKLTDSQVRNMLKLHHYTDVDSVTHHGNVITATAKKGGQKTKLSINARTGAIQSS